LILPSLFTELEGKALPKIIDEISKVKFLQNIVIGLDKANQKEFKIARNFFQDYLKGTKYYGMMAQT